MDTNEQATLTRAAIEAAAQTIATAIDRASQRNQVANLNKIANRASAAAAAEAIEDLILRDSNSDSSIDCLLDRATRRHLKTASDLLRNF